MRDHPEFWRTVRLLGVAAIAVAPFYFMADNVDADEIKKSGISAIMVAIAASIGRMMGVGDKN